MEIGQPNFAAMLAAKFYEPTLEDLASEIDRILRKHFSCSAMPARQVGIGVLCHEYEPETLEATIEREAQVTREVAEQVAHLIRARDTDNYHRPSCRYLNQTERQASLQSFWSSLRGDELDPVKLNDNNANNAVGRALEMIERRAPQAFRWLEAGTPLWRGRADENFSLWEAVQADGYCALGAHPNGRANRLNPEGIRCFYGANDVQTALSELRVETGWIIYLGNFTLTRNVPILDLQLLKQAPWPSVFAGDYKEQAYEVGVIRGIPNELAHAPWKGGGDHVYRPARYFAEFCRQRQSDRIAGLLYPSSQHPSGFNIALFADKWDGSNDPIRLTSIHTTQILSRTTRARGVDVCLDGVDPLDTDE
ncbi:RES family NAD+ phosphorylase [Chitinimonas lacunae]|uniref:RES family NAD+ phosphorylase n=1 Tax=Chitinimonas lacunae TaxID=1963018 RepID=A0ABV8MQD7_9NEIS